MVIFGFVSSSERCPDQVRHVCFQPARASSVPSLPAEAEIAPDRRGQTRWLLTWNIPEQAPPEIWARRMGRQMRGLDWNPWCLNTPSLARTLDLPADQALRLWGDPFWSVYLTDLHDDVLVYLAVGDQRRLIYQAVRHWEARFPDIRFATEHDLDGAKAGRR